MPSQTYDFWPPPTPLATQIKAWIADAVYTTVWEEDEDETIDSGETIVKPGIALFSFAISVALFFFCINSAYVNRKVVTIYNRLVEYRIATIQRLKEHLHSFPGVLTPAFFFFFVWSLFMYRSADGTIWFKLKHWMGLDDGTAHPLFVLLLWCFVPAFHLNEKRLARNNRLDRAERERNRPPRRVQVPRNNRQQALAVAPARLTIAELNSLLENIFADLDWLSEEAKRFLPTPDWRQIELDPFTWPDGTAIPWAAFIAVPSIHNTRWRRSVTVLGLEIVIICVHTRAFINYMLHPNTINEHWDDLLTEVVKWRRDLRMFAMTRNIPYATHFNNSELSTRHGMGVLALRPHMNAHPHELYLTAVGGIRKNSFVSDRNRSTLQVNIEDNIWNSNDFGGGGLSRPRIKTRWPVDWNWPQIPSTAEANNKGPYAPCDWCQRAVISFPLLTPKSERQLECICEKAGFREPFVIIKEIGRQNGHQLNPPKAVITLISIPKDNILGEFTGRFLHPDLESSYHNDIDHWAHNFEGPFGQRPDGLWTREPYTAVLDASIEGNWTRFMRWSISPATRNVRLVNRALGGKLRILAIATRDIDFGEELFASYEADVYPGNEGGPLRIQRGNAQRRLNRR